MLNIITDSLYHYSKNKDFICRQELFKWSLKSNKNEYSLVKKELDKKVINKIKDSELIGIISPSNYKLLYDLKDLNVKKLYAPEFYDKKIILQVDYKKVEKSFERLLKRSYLSYLNYEKLQNLGLNRVEQFIILSNLALFEKYKNIDNINLQEGTYEIVKVEKIKDTKLKSHKISFLKCIRMMNKKYNLSFEEASKLLLQEYSYLKISDVFSEEGFVPLQKIELKDFNKVLFDILKNEYEIEEFKVTLKVNKKEKSVIIRKMLNYNEDISNYYGLQKEDYFIGKYILVNKSEENIEFLYEFVKKIIPFKDFILTLKALIKLNKLKEDGVFLTVEDTKALNLKYNREWISPNTWERIYEHQDFDFFNILDEIDTNENEFKCPSCEGKYYETTPTKFFCKNRDCGFIFYRNSLKFLDIKAVNAAKFKEGIIHKKVFVKNKDGRNFLVHLKNRKNFYFFSKD